MTESVRRNIRLYGYFRIFSKRVYIPLTVVYLVEVGHVSLGQIGILASVGAATALISQLPTGYFADRCSRKASLVVGASILLLSATFLAFWPSLIGAVLSFISADLGYAFMVGAGEALIHDSLEELGEAKNYTHVMGRAQSVGLVSNVVLVGLVPLTYTINKRLPFIIGIFAMLFLLGITLSFVEPKRRQRLQSMSFVKGLRLFVNRRTILLFLGIGLVSALYNAGASYTTLIFKDLGLKPSLLGWVFAGSSVFGAIIGYLIHHLKKLSLGGYVLLDGLIALGFFAAVGLSHNLVVAIGSFVVNLGFWRLRSIFYQDKLLKLFHKAGYKATLISTLGFFDQINELWLTLIFAAAVLRFGYYHSYTGVAATFTLILSPLFVLALWRLKKRSTSG